MKLLSLNIEIDRHHDLVKNLIKNENPDVMCFQEFLERDFEMYKEWTGYEGVFLPRVYINHVAQGGPQNVRYGIAIFAKSITKSGSFFYEGSHEHIELPFEEYFKTMKSEGEEERGLLWVDVLHDGVVYRVATTHFTMSLDPSFMEKRKQAIRYEAEEHSAPNQIASVHKLLPLLSSLGDFILAADMNAPRGLEAWALFADKYKDNIPLLYTTSIDKDFHRAGDLQLMVDCLFTTPSYTTSDVKLVSGVSDHFAVVATIEKN